VTLGAVKVRPASVTIEGAESEVKNVDEVETETVDISAVQESFALTIPINYRGTYTALKEQKTVEVEVHINQQQAEPIDPVIIVPPPNKNK
jgi:YbbR domain-containing protein